MAEEDIGQRARINHQGVGREAAGEGEVGVRGKSASRPTRSTLVTVLLVLGVVAVVTGYFLGRAALSFLGGPTAGTSGPAAPSGGGSGGGDGVTPGTGAGPPPAGVPSAAASLRLPTVTLFRVQAGAFSVRENAWALAESLERRGFAAVVVEPAPYRVVVGLFSDGRAADRLAAALSAAGQEVYQAAWVLNAAPVKVVGPSGYVKWLEAELGGLAGLVAREAVVWDSYWLGEPQPFATVASLEEEARRLASAVVGVSVPQELAGAHDRLLQLTGSAVQSVFELRALERGGEASPAAAYGAFLDLVAGYDSLVRGLGGGGA
ncbi:MAG: SPOR domain-containing protein [Acetobacteraceae bacterium]|nr:SPOR domain-containing protein [Acetobacteraceae bacterium]